MVIQATSHSLETLMLSFMDWDLRELGSEEVTSSSIPSDPTILSFATGGVRITCGQTKIHIPEKYV